MVATTVPRALIRIIDLQTLDVIVKLAAHFTTEIMLIQNVPIIRNFNLAVDGSNIVMPKVGGNSTSMLCNGVRFISVGADNSAYLWFMTLQL